MHRTTSGRTSNQRSSYLILPAAKIDFGPTILFENTGYHHQSQQNCKSLHSLELLQMVGSKFAPKMCNLRKKPSISMFKVFRFMVIGDLRYYIECIWLCYKIWKYTKWFEHHKNKLWFITTEFCESLQIIFPPGSSSP